MKVDAYNYHQYRLDKTALMVGIAYFLFVLFLFVLHSGNIVLQLSGWWDKGVKFILAVCPAVYVARSFYGFLIKWNQNANTAKAYFQNNDIKYKA